MSSLSGGLSRPHENGRLELRRALPRGSPATRYAVTLITTRSSSSIYFASIKSTSLNCFSRR